MCVTTSYCCRECVEMRKLYRTSMKGSKVRVMGIRMDQPLREMSLATLGERCIQEMGKYRRKEQSDDRYCLEIMRRAVMLHDNDAWVVLRLLFSDSVRLWFARHPCREAAL